MYTIQYTLYIVHCTIYTVQCTMNNVQCTVYIVPCTMNFAMAASYVYKQKKYEKSIRDYFILLIISITLTWWPTTLAYRSIDLVFSYQYRLSADDFLVCTATCTH